METGKISPHGLYRRVLAVVDSGRFEERFGFLVCERMSWIRKRIEDRSDDVWDSDIVDSC